MEAPLVEPLFDVMLTVNFPEKLIEDKACDADKLDRALARQAWN
jgi:hypothetical protein